MKLSHFLPALLAGMTLVLGCSSTTETPADTTMRIGAILPMTGAGSNLGETAKAAIEVAVQDFNDFMVLTNSPMMIELDTANSNSDPTVAAQHLNDMADRGIRFFVGPMTSAESNVAIPIANNRDLILLSPSAVANSLSIPNDNFFRMITDVTMQGEACAAHLEADSIRYLIAIKRDDLWGNDLLKATKSAFETRGGTVTKEITYAVGTTDFATTLASLRSEVASAITLYGAKSVGIQLMSLGEGIEILTLAATDPELRKIKWLGNSAIARDPRITTRELTEFAQAVGLQCAVFGIEAQAERMWGPVNEKVRAKIGRDADSYALAAYDAVWLTAFNILDASNADIDAMRKVVIQNASTYYGATGWTEMNANGDRRQSNFDFWSIRSGLNGIGMWYRSAVYTQVDGAYQLRKL